jgi:hypothetical protein
MNENTEQIESESLDPEQIEAKKTIEFLKMTILEKQNVIGNDARHDIIRLRLVIYDLEQFWDV